MQKTSNKLQNYICITSRDENYLRSLNKKGTGIITTIEIPILII